MSPSILLKLESSRKELLDLGLRNPLINYKRPRSKGVQITDEKSAAIFDLLVRQNKAISFLGKPEASTQEIEFAEGTPCLSVLELENIFLKSSPGIIHQFLVPCQKQKK